jgi:uncharacterized protein YgbK (DUF1537 family)
MPQASIVILADDFTGATDAALAFAKLGARTGVWLDRPGSLDGADVAAIDLDTRTLPPAAAAARVSGLLRSLPAQVKVLKKIDSTLRGNIAVETEALLALREDAVAVVVPAHPKLGRVQRGGVLYVDGVPVHETDFGRDLFAPVHDSDVRSHLPVGPAVVLPAPGTFADTGALERELAAAARAGVRTVTIDAETEDDLAAIAELADEGGYIWVGSAGLLEALAAKLVEAVSLEGNARVAGPVLFVIGSLSAMTRAQIARFCEHGGVTEMVHPRTVLIDEGRSRARASVERIESALAAGSDVLVALSSDRIDVEAALSMGRLHGFDVATTSRELRERFVELVVPALPKAGTVVLSGADVARTFFSTAGIEGIRLLGEVLPDIPIARAIGHDLLVVTKGGGSGTPETYERLAHLARTSQLR